MVIFISKIEKAATLFIYQRYNYKIKIKLGK